MTQTQPGYVHIYTGNGKGKTTAALGLALRAAGAGRRVLITQFLKTASCSEHKALERFSDLITVHCYGTGDFIRGKVRSEHRLAATAGFAELSERLQTGNYSVVVCDEIISALNIGLLSKEQMVTMIKNRPSRSELVLTGRDAPDYLIEIADLVTEMVEVKHYYTAGVVARAGIEK
jgi:cob(I)alamin adenosyltransferase